MEQKVIKPKRKPPVRQTVFKAILVPDSVREMFTSRRGDQTNGDYLLELMRK